MQITNSFTQIFRRVIPFKLSFIAKMILMNVTMALLRRNYSKLTPLCVTVCAEILISTTHRIF